MKRVVLIFFLIYSGFTYSQIVKTRGTLTKRAGVFYFAYGIVISEPSHLWSFISFSDFELNCLATDTSLFFNSNGEQFRYKINHLKNFYTITIDSLEDQNLEQIDFKDDEYSIIFYNDGMALDRFQYFISNNFIRGSRQIDNAVYGANKIFLYKTDSLFNKKIRADIIEIIKKLPAKGYSSEDYQNNNGKSVDDGIEIGLKINYQNKIYNYEFQMYYNESVDQLMKDINTIVNNDDFTLVHAIKDFYENDY